MSEQELKRIESQLISARENGLLKLNETNLQSRGKLFGMDAFSWCFPNIEVLKSTINSFPFQVYWIGNRTEIELVLQENNILDSRVKIKSIFQSPWEFENALKSLNENAFKPGVFLFTTTDSEAEYYVNRFNEFLSLVQLK
jgi:hypothetical protein